MKKNLEVYIAGSISRPCEQAWHSQISQKLIEMGYTTYAPAENKKINDKNNKPTPEDIYDGDVSKLDSCDVVLVELHGGKQDGTIWECGFTSGYNHLVTSNALNLPLKKLFFYTSNTRLLNNMEWNGIPSESLNHLVLGGFVKWGQFLGNPDEMLVYMEKLINGEVE